MNTSNSASMSNGDSRPSPPQANPPSSHYNPSSQQLRNLVLSYLCHHCYVSTARVLAQSKSMDTLLEDKAKSAPVVLDADGDQVMDVGNTSDMLVESMVTADTEEDAVATDLDEETLQIASVRAEVREHILEGRIDAARQLLDAKFPSVLNPTPISRITTLSDAFSSQPRTQSSMNESPISLDPRHLSLNLSIQEFVESMRTIPLSRSRSRSQLSSSTPADAPMPGTSDPQKMLARAQNLSMLVSELPSPSDQAVYMTELQSVSALMAYHVPEASPVAKYMGIERREAVAEQINRAVLYRTNQNPVPHLQRYAEHITVVWSLMGELGVTLPPASSYPPSTPSLHRSRRDGNVEGKNSGGDSLIAPFDLAAFVAAKP